MDVDVVLLMMKHWKVSRKRARFYWYLESILSSEWLIGLVWQALTGKSTMRHLKTESFIQRFIEAWPSNLKFNQSILRTAGSQFMIHKYLLKEMKKKLSTLLHNKKLNCEKGLSLAYEKVSHFTLRSMDFMPYLDWYMPTFCNACVRLRVLMV